MTELGIVTQQRDIIEGLDGGGGVDGGSRCRIKEGVLLRNISAAPICDHFTVGPPGSGIRKVGQF